MASSGFAEGHQNVTEQTYVDQDRYGAELDGLQVTDCAFRRVDFTEARIRASVFERCRFANCKFNVSQQQHSAFIACQFRRCSFFSALLDGCKMSGSTWEDCELRPMTVRGGRWNGVTMRGAQLAGVDLAGVDLSESDFSESDLSGANLADANLSRARLRNTVLTDATLAGATLEAVDLSVAALGNTHVDVAGAISVAAAFGAVLD